MCKYVERRFLARPAAAAGSGSVHLLQEWLWEAVQRGDVQSGEVQRGGRGVCMCVCVLMKVMDVAQLYCSHNCTPCSPPRPPAAYHALACGANANHPYNSQPAAQLVWEANMQAGGAEDQPLSPSNLGHSSVLHAACRVRCVRRDASCAVVSLEAAP